MAYIAASYIISAGINSGLVGTVASSITSLTASIYSTISCIGDTHETEIARLINKLDLKYKISMIEKLISKYLPEDVSDDFVIVNHVCINNLKNSMTLPELTVVYLMEALDRVNTDLLELFSKIENHKKKYFFKYRILHVKPLMIRLEEDKQILDSRFDDFLKVLKLE